MEATEGGRDVGGGSLCCGYDISRSGRGEDAIKDGRYHSKMTELCRLRAPIGNRYGWSLCAEGLQREIVSVVIWLVVVEKVERGK